MLWCCSLIINQITRNKCEFAQEIYAGLTRYSAEIYQELTKNLAGI